jgi:hypothetical protein
MQGETLLLSDKNDSKLKQLDSSHKC